MPLLTVSHHFLITLFALLSVAGKKSSEKPKETFLGANIISFEMGRFDDPRNLNYY